MPRLEQGSSMVDSMGSLRPAPNVSEHPMPVLGTPCVDVLRLSSKCEIRVLLIRGGSYDIGISLDR